ncbi:methionine--tRNA ligase subunit beta [Candidatus Woesearchaeota archaeon]|nr:methionine--tRNA ligase subunit beta [Candidatus Woesearchaeota archaeon]
MGEIEFNDWEKLDFRIGEIKSAEDHPTADKLYVLNVDLGNKEVTLVAGIRTHYKKDDLIGKKIVVFTNLKPAVLRGVKSEGMLLAAEKDGKVILLTVDKDIDNGAKIR